jgi:hypothetical protein
MGNGFGFGVWHLVMAVGYCVGVGLIAGYQDLQTLA